MTISVAWIARLKRHRTIKPMTIFLVVLLMIIVACSLTFGVALLRRSLDDADSWLKIFSAVLGALIFAVGMAALITGHFVGQVQQREISAQKEKLLALEESNIAAQSRLEVERKERLELEEIVAPRRIRDSEAIAAKLEQYAGVNVIVETLADRESLYTGLQIAKVAGKAKWKVVQGVNVVLDGDPLYRNSEGVTVEINSGWREKDDRSDDAGTTLMEHLVEQGIEAVVKPAWPMLAPNTIRIRVGLKPLTYFWSPEQRKEAQEQIQRMIEYQRRVREAGEKEKK